MSVLHICSDYPFTSLYQQLLAHFSTETEQYHTMYVPMAVGRSFSHKYDYESSIARVLYSADFRTWDRFFYHRKRKKILAAIARKIPPDTVDLVHAHYLFSAGGVAYAMKQTQDIPYVVAVRNSDVNSFFRYAVHLRSFGARILGEAAKVVFLSPAYRETVLDRCVSAPLRETIAAKSVVIPNGVNDFWLNNRFSRPPRRGRGQVNLLFVGRFTRNKNMGASLRATHLLRSRGYSARLTLVGDGPEAPRFRRLADQNPDLVQVHSWIEEKNDLMAIYQESDIFLMPSFTETFGLAYVEAMSQGLPVIYTRGQGIDGYFADGVVGYACNPMDVVDITNKVEKILDQYDRISAACTGAVGGFSWQGIAREYEGIYSSVVGRGGEGV